MPPPWGTARGTGNLSCRRSIPRISGVRARKFGHSRWTSAVGTIIGPIEIQLFAMPVTGELSVDNLEIGPIEIELAVVDGSESGGDLVEGGGPPPPAFSVTGDIVMELTFLPFRPRYAVEITDTTDGLVDP